LSKDSLRTPEVKVREFQEKLHRSAKADKSRRFHQLYDKVWAPWVLEVAWQKVRSNKGAAGPDGMTIQQVEAAGAQSLLEQLSRELRKKSYRTSPIRRVYIPKANGKLRPLGIPNVRDRIVQAAVVLVLEPIFEADLPDSAYGFRPGRNAHQALEAIRMYLAYGYTDVVDADLEAYFDTIPHENLLKLVAERIVDRGVLWLISQWLQAPVIEPTDPPGSTGRKSDRGTPQGGVISPLLANIYHACIPRIWTQWDETKHLDSRLVSYADDFVILLKPGRGKRAMQALDRICTRLSLKLSAEKTRVVQAEEESFHFLGFEIQKVLNPKSGKRWPRVTPSRTSEQRLRDRLREILNRKTARLPVAWALGEVNPLLRGWSGYFYFGYPQLAMRRLNHFAEQRLRKWLTRRHNKRGQGFTRYTHKLLYEQYGLYRLPTRRPGWTPNARG
jgi:RNA-directed DNA polymerase